MDEHRWATVTVAFVGFSVGIGYALYGILGLFVSAFGDVLGVAADDIPIAEVGGLTGMYALAGGWGVMATDSSVRRAIFARKRRRRIGHIVEACGRFLTFPVATWFLAAIAVAGEDHLNPRPLFSTWIAPSSWTTGGMGIAAGMAAAVGLGLWIAGRRMRRS